MELGKFILQHDNVRPHVVTETKDFIICSLGSLESSPSYSPDVASLNYLFRSLQHHLTDKHFKIIEVQKSIDDFINSKAPFFSKMRFVNTKGGAVIK